jgi:hypothetical protein
MNTSTSSLITGFFLVLLAGIGFGIAQADGTYMDRSLYDSPYYEQLEVTNAPEEEVDLHGPIAAGALPSESDLSVDDVDSQDQVEYSVVTE